MKGLKTYKIKYRWYFRPDSQRFVPNNPPRLDEKAL